jgi:hypothetical protein
LWVVAFRKRVLVVVAVRGQKREPVPLAGTMSLL